MFESPFHNLMEMALCAPSANVKKLFSLLFQNEELEERVWLASWWRA
jgi:hypothetical protein